MHPSPIATGKELIEKVAPRDPNAKNDLVGGLKNRIALHLLSTLILKNLIYPLPQSKLLWRKSEEFQIKLEEIKQENQDKQ